MLTQINGQGITDPEIGRFVVMRVLRPLSQRLAVDAFHLLTRAGIGS
jgi:hypothetical protein